MTNRKVTLLSKEITDLLVKQVAHELKNFNLYRSYANFFSVSGLVDLEEYYNKRAHEEYNHHDWISTYLSDADCKIMYPMVEQNTETFEDFIDPFIQTVDREILTTQMIYVIYEKAIAEKDFMTASWLYDKLIKEQIEEENLSRQACTIMSTDGDIFVKSEAILDLLS